MYLLALCPCEPTAVAVASSLQACDPQSGPEQQLIGRCGVMVWVDPPDFRLTISSVNWIVLSMAEVYSESERFTLPGRNCAKSAPFILCLT
jgi:hypothetical protein